MAATKPKVVVTRKLPDPVESRMRELFDVDAERRRRGRWTPQALGDALAQADVLVPTVTDRIDARLLAKAGPQLKLIANFGAGVDNIDVAAANDARHHRHQHARRPHRGHRRHDAWP